MPHRVSGLHNISDDGKRIKTSTYWNSYPGAELSYPGTKLPLMIIFPRWKGRRLPRKGRKMARPEISCPERWVCGQYMHLKASKPAVDWLFEYLFVPTTTTTTPTHLHPKGYDCIRRARSDILMWTEHLPTLVNNYLQKIRMAWQDPATGN